MNIFKNKYFLLGNLAFLLLAIPVVLFFVKNQTSTRGSAAATTTLSFADSPSITTDQCDATKTSKLLLNPGQNVVATVQLALKWDKTKFDIEFTPNAAVFPPPPLAGPEQTTEGMTVTLTIGSDTTKAITITKEIATIKIIPKTPTNGQDTKLEIDETGTKVWSFPQENEGTNENVYNAAGSSPLPVNITAKTCTDTTNNPTATATPTPTQAGSATIPTATPTPVSTGATATPTPTATPTTVPGTPTATPTTVTANKSPVCLNLSTTASSGSAPLAITVTANGGDGDGTVSKASFNFGDGTQQDVTNGMGSASVSAQLSHTYNSGGTFNATAVFTDNRGAVSLTCTQQITVSGAIATTAPTATATLAPISSSAPTATPTIAPSGSISVTFGIIAGILVVVVAGIFLLAL